MFRKLVLLLFTGCAFIQPSQAEIPQNMPLGSILPHEISFVIQDLTTGDVIAQHNAFKPMNPASVMKLVTAFVAFDQLGENFRWRTTLTTDASIKNGTLMGDLYWRGSGDPVFDQDDLVEMQEQLRKRGVHHVAGSLILDRSVWDSIAPANGFENDAQRVFATDPDQHMLAYKVLAVDAQQTITGSLDFNFNLPIQNAIEVSDRGRCGNMKNLIKTGLMGDTLQVWGTVPASCSGQKTYVNLSSLKAEEFARASFISHWRQQGGTIAATALTNTAPSTSKVLAFHDSPPLSDVIYDMNKASNNIIARSVFLTLGAKISHENTVRNAQSAVFLSLRKNGIDDTDLQIENGSGLSRIARIRASTMAAILQKAYSANFRISFIHSLPIAGVDGTLKRRLGDVPNLYLKTGTLNGVRSLAGYKLPTQMGEHPLAVVVFVNGPRTASQASDLDRIVRFLLNAPSSDKTVYHSASLREAKQNYNG